MKTFLIVLISFLVGIFAAGAGGMWALQNGYIAGFSAPLVQPEWPDVSPVVGDRPEVADDVKIEDQVLPVPKSVASENFQKALELTVATHNDLAVAVELLVEKLNEMNARSASRNFDGFFDLVFDAKTLLSEQVSGTGNLALALADLERELPTVTDQGLAVASASLVAKGKVLVASLGRYSAAVDPVLSGNIPNQEMINLIFESATDLQAASKDFNGAAESTVAEIRAALDEAPIVQTQRVNGAL
jgi:hypothetical protein